MIQRFFFLKEFVKERCLLEVSLLAIEEFTSSLILEKIDDFPMFVSRLFLGVVGIGSMGGV